MTDEVRYANVAAARVGYAVHGAGDLDIVYSPGLASHLDLSMEQPRYQRYIETLMRYGRVIRFDRRGVGVSDAVPPDAGESWEMWADDLAAVLEAAGSRHAVIIATNDAGAAGILFAATRPDLVQALVLFNTTARFLAAPDYPEGHSAEVAELIVETLRSTWGTEAATDFLCPSLAADEPYRRWYARFQRGACSPGEMAESLSRLLEMDARRVLPEVQCPTLVVHREEYGALTVDHARALARGIPHAELAVVPGGDATIYSEGVGDIAERIGAFLGRTPTPPPDNRVFTTVLFTDIVSSTERAVSLGDDGWRRLLDAHDAAARDAIGRHGGRIIKGTGDGTLATFEAPTRALRCASELRRHLRGLGIDVRAGVHAGPVVVRNDGDISGVAVNAAARVLGQAEDGGVLVSEAVVDLVTGDEFEFADVGERTLKGLPGTWRLFGATRATG